MDTKSPSKKRRTGRKTEADPKWGRCRAWWSEPGHLKGESMNQLARLLGVGSIEDKALLCGAVESAVGQYYGGAREAMERPSPAGKLAALGEIARLSGELQGRLKELHPETEADLISATRLYRVPRFLPELRESLHRLETSAWTAEREIEDDGKESRGGGLKDQARDYVAFNLTDIFRRFDKDAGGRGASKRRAAFVTAALRAGGIPSPEWPEMQRKLAPIPLNAGV